MNDDQVLDQRLDDGPLDMSAHDQTSDMSLDTALSIRAAAARADVTEKTIRRWIKAGRLHAVKLGGQYRITAADLDLAIDAPPDATVHAGDTTRPDSGQDSPRVDMSSGPDSGHAPVQDQQRAGSIDIAPLVDHIARLEQQVGHLTETSTMWQMRAMHLEEQLKQLSATAESADEAVDATESDESAEEDAEQGQAAPGAPAGVWTRLVRFLQGH